MSVQFLAVFIHCAVTSLWFMLTHNHPFVAQTLGDLPMLVSRAETVGDALARVNDYLYLHSSGVTLIIHGSHRKVITL